MPERIDDRLRVGLTAGEESATAVRVDDDAPFCVLIAGNFGGGKAGERPARTIAVDRDDIDHVVARVAPALELPSQADERMRVEFGSLDDFHPDRLFERVPIFQAMTELRAAVSRFGPTARSRDSGSAGGGPIQAEALLSGGGLLDSIVGATPGTGSERDPLAAFLRDAVEPHLTREPDAAQVDARAAIDRHITTWLRALLHDRAFQRLEARWRAIDMLARRLETGERLKLFIADIAFAPGDERAGAALDQLIAAGPGGTAAGAPWAIVVLDWEVAPIASHLAALARAAATARRAGAILLAGADPRLAEFAAADAGMVPADSAALRASWDAFRSSPAARHVGLVLPRFLLRLPYGRATDPCDAFALEEMEADPPPHDSYLWANGAFAAALVLARAFEDAGWQLERALRPDIGGLPLHAIDDGTDLKPCAEVLMDERTAGALLDAGIMPLASMKHADSVHLVRVQSAARPVAPLAGAWARGR